MRQDSGLANLPLHDLNQNRIWCAIVALACEITSWLQLLALSGHQTRRWEPRRLRLRLFSIVGPLIHYRPTPHPAPARPRLALHALTTLRALTSRTAPSG